MKDSREIKILISKCNSGDKTAWEELYSMYLPKVRSIARNFCRNKPYSEDDLIQDIFIQLMKALHHFDPSRSLDVYIMEIARRVAVSNFRRHHAKKRHANAEISFDQDLPTTELPDPQSNNPEILIIREEQNKKVREALEEISDDCRKLLTMRYDLGLAYKEMAIELSANESTLRVRVQRCLSVLGELLRGSSAQNREWVVNDG